jgi:hypothetical protein
MLHHNFRQSATAQKAAAFLHAVRLLEKNDKSAIAWLKVRKRILTCLNHFQHRPGGLCVKRRREQEALTVPTT